MSVQMIDYPNDKPRIETGAVQFGSDWPGLFIRGDNAAWLAFEAQQVLEWYNNLPAEHRCFMVMSMLTSLTSLGRIVNRDVIVK